MGYSTFSPFFYFEKDKQLPKTTFHDYSFHYSLLITFSILPRPYWRCYYSNTDAIIYVVDSADKDRIGISKDELLYMLRVCMNYHYYNCFCKVDFKLLF